MSIGKMLQTFGAGGKMPKTTFCAFFSYGRFFLSGQIVPAKQGSSILRSFLSKQTIWPLLKSQIDDGMKSKPVFSQMKTPVFTEEADMYLERIFGDTYILAFKHFLGVFIFLR
jgi:hypothetical protein